MSTPTVAMTQVMIDWITAMGWDGAQELGFPLFPGTYIIEAPDQAVFITSTGGPGFVTEEGGADAWQFQARIRGTTDDVYGPEIAALRLDQMILGARFPITVDGITIAHVHRAASPPTPLPVAPDELRHEFTCQYIAVLGV